MGETEGFPNAALNRSAYEFPTGVVQPGQGQPGEHGGLAGVFDRTPRRYLTDPDFPLRGRRRPGHVG